MRLILFLIAVLFSIPAIGAESSWIRHEFKSSKAKNLYCPSGTQSSQCLQFSTTGISNFGNKRTYLCESGHSEDGTSCYMGGCIDGASPLPAFRAQMICQPNMQGRNIKSAIAPGGVAASVTCDPGTRVVGCHSYGSDGHPGCGINITANGQTCTSNPCSANKIVAICAAKEMRYIFNAKSANEHKCPAGYTVSACHNIDMPNGHSQTFGLPYSQNGSIGGGDLSGTLPFTCQFISGRTNYLFCAKD